MVIDRKCPSWRNVATTSRSGAVYGGRPLPQLTRDDLLGSIRADWRETIAAARVSAFAPRRTLRMIKV
jgi:hypothetical protein